MSGTTTTPNLANILATPIPGRLSVECLLELADLGTEKIIQRILVRLNALGHDMDNYTNKSSDGPLSLLHTILRRLQMRDELVTLSNAADRRRNPDEKSVIKYGPADTSGMTEQVRGWLLRMDWQLSVEQRLLDLRDPVSENDPASGLPIATTAKVAKVLAIPPPITEPSISTLDCLADIGGEGSIRSILRTLHKLGYDTNEDSKVPEFLRKTLTCFYIGNGNLSFSGGHRTYDAVQTTKRKAGREAVQLYGWLISIEDQLLALV